MFMHSRCEMILTHSGSVNFSFVACEREVVQSHHAVLWCVQLTSSARVISFDIPPFFFTKKKTVLMGLSVAVKSKVLLTKLSIDIAFSLKRVVYSIKQVLQIAELYFGLILNYYLFKLSTKFIIFVKFVSPAVPALL